MVYPRARGGAYLHPCVAPAYDGLSPRTRGSQTPDPVVRLGVRSIPAHAGEPPWAAGSWGCRRVYPRARGGAIAITAAAKAGKGLSPRTRGSRIDYADARRDERSIPPAHAGEPLRAVERTVLTEVYPRARGGAVWRRSPNRKGMGLSPRTRGSLLLSAARFRAERSIPAHAGEPASQEVDSLASEVYPRARGGAGRAGPATPPLRGLSPRTRGSRRGWPPLYVRGGSIPAHAGEPARRWCQGTSEGVYPRARGGAELLR